MVDALFLAIPTIAIVGWALLTLLNGRQVIGVSPWERGALYRDGAYERLLPPGRHVLWGAPKGRVHVDRISLTPQYAVIAPVEAVSSDGMPLRVTATVVYRIVDAELAVREPVWSLLHLKASTAIAQVAAGYNLQDLIGHGPVLDEALTERLGGTVGAAEIVSAQVTAVILPPELRRLMSEVERARLEGLAALERARGEQAALRALANAARLLKDNPELERLRTLQAVSGARNATLILGDPNAARP